MARHGEDWNENRIVGVSTRCTCIGVRKRKRERERGEEREKAEGLGARGGGKGSYSTGMAMTGGSVYPAGDPIGWDRSLLPFPSTSSRHVADRQSGSR